MQLGGRRGGGDFIVKHFHVHLLVAHDGVRSGLNLMKMTMDQNDIK